VGKVSVSGEDLWPRPYTLSTKLLIHLDLPNQSLDPRSRSLPWEREKVSWGQFKFVSDREGGSKSINHINRADKV